MLDGKSVVLCVCSCSAVLIGEPGVGKTSIIHGLAQRLITGDVPESISGAKLFALELGLLTAGWLDWRGWDAVLRFHQPACIRGHCCGL